MIIKLSTQNLVFTLLFWLFAITASADSIEQSEVESIISAFAANLGNLKNVQKLKLENMTKQPLTQSEMIIYNSVEIEFPDKMTLSFAGEEFVIEGDLVHRRYEQGYFERLPEELSQRILTPFRQNIIYLAKYFSELEIAYLGELRVDGKDFYKLKVVDYDYEVLIDSSNFLLVEIRYQTGEEKRIKRLSDYQIFSGILYPGQILVSDEEGNLISKIKVISLETD